MSELSVPEPSLLGPVEIVTILDLVLVTKDDAGGVVLAHDRLDSETVNTALAVLAGSER